LRFSEGLEEVSSIGSGCQLFIHAGFELGSCAYFALGERGKPAEQVGQEAALQFLKYYDGSGAVDQYLADQLLIPAALQEKFCSYTCNQVTDHLLTNRAIIAKFHSGEIRIEGEPGMAGNVAVGTRQPTTKF
jgi:RNA 3'-terminal phosphate cyclase (ATP)